MPSFVRAVACCLVSLLTALVSASTAPVSSYPLAVRNPYLSAWLPHNLAGDAPTAQAQFWTGMDLTWPVLARVNGRTYTLFGAPRGVTNATAAKQTSISYTSTHTTIQLTAGPATVELDFFSPVSPLNLVRQSLPYSYLTVTASGSSNPTVEVFSAFDQSWTGASSLTDDFSTSGTTLVHSIYPTKSTPYTENEEMAAYGTAVFAAQPIGSQSVTYQSGPRANVEQAFVSQGALTNHTSGYASGNLWAFAVNLGAVGSAGKAARFAVGFDRIHAINFMGTSYSAYSRSQVSTVPAAAAHFLSDYASAYPESQTLDAKVVSKGNGFSSNYTDLLALSVRQIYGAMEVVIPTTSLNTSDVLVFLKEISSDGDVSTVDVIYPTLPALYLISPDFLQLLVKPYLIYMNSGQWPKQYVPHDLGKYPNAIGHNDGSGENIYVEATGSLFILIQMYNQAANASNAWLQPYLNPLHVAGDWLVKNGLYPASQRSTVDAIRASANQTGLAQSAAIGLKALGAALGLSNYTDSGTSFGKQIYPKLGTNDPSKPTHFTYNYGAPTGWATTFDLTADNVLGLNTFPTAAATMQAAWYNSQFLPNGGIPYAGSVNFVVTEWLFWAGALSQKVAASQAVQGRAIALLHQYITNGLNNVPFPTKFNVRGDNIGVFIANKARSTVGAMWAPMMLNGNWGTGIS